MAIGDFLDRLGQPGVPQIVPRKHVHILISPLLNPGLVYEEVVPDTYHKIQVVEYYKERGWDVLVISDEEVCGKE